MQNAVLRVIDTKVTNIVPCSIGHGQVQHPADARVVGCSVPEMAIGSRCVVVGELEYLGGPQHLIAIGGDTVERVSRAFVYETTVDVQQRVARRPGLDRVLLPDLVEQCF